MRQSEPVRISPVLSLHRHDDGVALSIDADAEGPVILDRRQAGALAKTLRDMLKDKVRLNPYSAGDVAEGDWFVVELSDDGAYAIGLLVRTDKAGAAYAYFWVPFQRSQSRPAELIGTLRPDEATLRAHVGTGGLESGDWQVVSSDAQFSRDGWPVPPVRRGLSTMGVFDDDTLRFASTAIPEDVDPSTLAEDVFFGSVAAQNHLRHLAGIPAPEGAS